MYKNLELMGYWIMNWIRIQRFLTELTHLLAQNLLLKFDSNLYCLTISTNKGGGVMTLKLT